MIAVSTNSCDALALAEAAALVSILVPQCSWVEVLGRQ